MSSGLDINTPRGRIAVEKQERAARIVFEHTHMKFFRTIDTGAAYMDGVAVKNGEIVYVVEIKSRDASFETLTNKWNCEWLVTLSKVEHLAKASLCMGVPGIGLLYLIRSNMVLVKRLTNPDGKIVCPYRSERTETQATINGGTANRMNAFIDMRLASHYEDPNPEPVFA